MTDKNNSGQSDNGEDTEQQAEKGGDPANSGSFVQQNAADPHDAGRRGAEAQPEEAKAEGCRHSGSGS